jgi:hypothetical protein
MTAPPMPRIDIQMFTRSPRISLAVSMRMASIQSRPRK